MYRTFAFQMEVSDTAEPIELANQVGELLDGNPALPDVIACVDWWEIRE